MQVIVAATGSEGTHLCRQYQDAIKVAVIDVRLPDTSVSELVASLTEAGFRGKRLFMSATPMNLLSQQEMAVVQDESFLQKPFAAEDLVAAVAAL
jgi:FixJ family two-component response regulator